jgi:geranylgeranyl pyrophosphate synthase
VQHGLKDFARRCSPFIEAALDARLPRSRLRGAGRLNEAIRYAVFSGGKRTRPLLALIAAQVCGARVEDAVGVACGLEFVHVSSLIIDDLPAMDDASTRRGVAAVHVAFGEDVALLAALALLNGAYEIFAATPGLLDEAVRAIGCDGMIGGQAADLSGRSTASRLEKTTSLMKLTMTAGAMVGRTGERELTALARYGQLVGEAYQICDDLLDVAASEATAGKTIGQDMRHGRFSPVPEFGVRGAWTRACALIEEANRTVQRQFGARAETELLTDAARLVTANVVHLVNGNGADDRGRVPAATRCG